MDFVNGKGLLKLCGEYQMPISGVMKQREIVTGKSPEEEIDRRLNKALEIMKDAAQQPLSSPKKSIGGLIGGEAGRVFEDSREDGGICGDTLSRAIAYSMAVLETNAAMGLIVAAPTAGSSGVVPGVLFSLQETYHLSEETIKCGLLNASAVGYLLMRNASVSGAEAGCQAEVGAASAMAASAAVEMLGGSADACLYAASMALSNLLGLACDPIAGLVEVPCQSRNGLGVANAFTCAQLALSGVFHPIPFDEMADAMYRAGRALPYELRETALGGSAGTPTGCRFGCGIRKRGQ